MAFIQEVDTLVDLYYKQHKKNAFYADQLNMSIKSINKILKRKRGKTLSQLIGERLHSEAIYLILKDDTVSIKRIAYELDFCDPGYFIRFFKKIEGVTPVAFRKMHEQ